MSERDPVRAYLEQFPVEAGLKALRGLTAFDLDP